MTDFTDDMDKLAAALAKDANLAEKNFGDRLDAFKALMPYYALLLKNKGKNDPDDENNFGAFADQILTAENQDGANEPGLRGSRRNGN